VIVSNLFLFLANGELNGTGFWLIDTSTSDEPLSENKSLLECHRKELIGQKSAEEIIYAINLNLNNLYDDLNKEGYKIEKPVKGISYSLPLTLLEKFFDFWLERYKKPSEWETCLGLLKIKQRFPLTSIISSSGIKGNVKEWAPRIENLHKYRPDSFNPTKVNEPMWK